MHLLDSMLIVAAAETGFDVTSVMTTSVDSVKGDLFKVLAIVVPVAAAITAAIVSVKFGMKWLRSLGK